MRQLTPIAGLCLLLLLTGCAALSQPAEQPVQTYPYTQLVTTEGAWPSGIFAPAVSEMGQPPGSSAKGDSTPPVSRPAGGEKGEKGKEDKKEGGEKEGEKNGKGNGKPPAPRTLPQAIRAYCRALRLSLHGIEEKPANGKNGGSKNGNDDKQPEGKKNPEPEEKKSPAPDKGQGAEPGTGTRGKQGSIRGGNGGGDVKLTAGTQEEPEGKKNPPPVSEQVPREKGEEKANGDKEEPKSEWYSAHGQATMVMQNHGRFNSPYQGTLSLSPLSETRTSETSTLFLDARLWEWGHHSSEFVFNPEIAGGRGFSNVNGLAGFTNGEITRVGVPQPTPYIARLFLREIWGMGGEQEDIEDGPNQIAGKRDINRFTLTGGKFAYTDYFDNNRYSHDPRTQFMNWSLMYNGAWDYPANVRGYTYGFVAELNRKYWALRYGLAAEPTFANGAPLDSNFGQAHGHALEWEGRWDVRERPGRVRVLGYLNRAHMGSYGEALLEMPVNPDVTATRAYRNKYGYALNAEQELTRDLGVWGRLGWNDGHTESWAFTPIDRTAAVGIVLRGRRWARPDDEVGLAGVCNGLAKVHREYLAAGGLDFSIGDGRLNYGLERILELYYRAAIVKGIYATVDYQYIKNPAYNRDRGPLSVWALLVHLEY